MAIQQHLTPDSVAIKRSRYGTAARLLRRRCHPNPPLDQVTNALEVGALFLSKEDLFRHPPPPTSTYCDPSLLGAIVPVEVSVQYPVPGDLRIQWKAQASWNHVHHQDIAIELHVILIVAAHGSDNRIQFLRSLGQRDAASRTMGCPDRMGLSTDDAGTSKRRPTPSAKLVIRWVGGRALAASLSHACDAQRLVAFVPG